MNAKPEREVQYKGYVITPIPDQLAESGRWTVKVSIARHSSSGVSQRPYSAANTYPTEEEAIKHSLNFGRQIIDGKAAVSLDL